MAAVKMCVEHFHGLQLDSILAVTIQTQATQKSSKTGVHKKGREICTTLGLDSDKMVDLASSMKANIWYLPMYLFTFCFYYCLDYVKVVKVTLQCIGMVATVLCYLGIVKPSCPGIVKPCCLGIYQYCCLGIYQSSFLGSYQLYCLGTFQPCSQDEDIQLGCPNEGLFGFAAQNEDFQACLPSIRSFQLCCPTRGLYSMASLMWTFQLSFGFPEEDFLAWPSWSREEMCQVQKHNSFVVGTVTAGFASFLEKTLCFINFRIFHEF